MYAEVKPQHIPRNTSSLAFYSISLSFPLSQRVVVHRILPALTSEFVNPDMVPFVLPNVLLIAEECTKDEYVRLILPDLTPVFKQQEPIQVDAQRSAVSSSLCSTRLFIVFCISLSMLSQASNMVSGFLF